MALTSMKYTICPCPLQNLDNGYFVFMVYATDIAGNQGSTTGTPFQVEAAGTTSKKKWVIIGAAAGGGGLLLLVSQGSMPGCSMRTGMSRCNT